ncbi:hypothetical protein [Rummeliibacillus stabekisii]|uniref:hypothetical protein n=1 Tax=Rummeliibacillus stabekisii TaxID=241244 RepID=UPI00371869DF
MNNIIITGFFSLGSSIIGAGIALFAQNLILRKQIKHEEEKENKARKNEYMAVCNQILMVDGENLIVTDSRNGYWNFDVSVYKKSVRPIIYSKFHLFDAELKEFILDIDMRIATADHDENWNSNVENQIAEIYLRFIQIIKNEQFIYEFVKDTQ